MNLCNTTVSYNQAEQLSIVLTYYIESGKRQRENDGVWWFYFFFTFVLFKFLPLFLLLLFLFRRSYRLSLTVHLAKPWVFLSHVTRPVVSCRWWSVLVKQVSRRPVYGMTRWPVCTPVSSTRRWWYSLRCCKWAGPVETSPPWHLPGIFLRTYTNRDFFKGADALFFSFSLTPNNQDYLQCIDSYWRTTCKHAHMYACLLNRPSFL